MKQKEEYFNFGEIKCDFCTGLCLEKHDTASQQGLPLASLLLRTIVPQKLSVEGKNYSMLVALIWGPDIKKCSTNSKSYYNSVPAFETNIFYKEFNGNAQRKNIQNQT